MTSHSDSILSNTAFLMEGHFIHILCTAFMRADPKSEKKSDSLIVFFDILGFVHVKTARLTVDDIRGLSTK